MSKEFVVGKHAVYEAIQTKRDIFKIYISKTLKKQTAMHILDLAEKEEIVIQEVENHILDDYAQGLNHQGMIAQTAHYSYVDLEKILKRAKSDKPGLILILDEIEDPRNLGSILRTAEAAGVHGVIIPKRRAAGLTAAVAKTSAGAIEHVPVACVTNLVQTMKELKNQGFWLVGTDVDSHESIYDTNIFTSCIGIVIGNEHRGLGRLVKENCDVLVSLPMFGQIQSLNASVATGVILYEAIRQRKLS